MDGASDLDVLDGWRTTVLAFEKICILWYTTIMNNEYRHILEVFMKKIYAEELMDGITIDRIERDYHYSMPSKHFHKEYELYYLLKGERNFFIDNQTFLIKKGTLVILDKNQVHKIESTENPGYDSIIIEIKEEPFSSFFSSDGRLSLQQFFKKHHGVREFNTQGQRYIESLLLCLIEEAQKKEPGYELMAKIKLSELFIFIMRCGFQKDSMSAVAMQKSSKHKTVSEAVDYITKNFMLTESLDELSNHFFVNKYYLSRIFKEITGFTIKEYINIQRIQQAQKLLSDSDYNISEIAELLGYENPSYFEKVFKKYTETTPLKYKKKLIQLKQERRGAGQTAAK